MKVYVVVKLAENPEWFEKKFVVKVFDNEPAAYEFICFENNLGDGTYEVLETELESKA